MKSIKDKLTKELLLSVLKPARYIGGELNAVKKDLSCVDVKVCLCFPDVYEIGMSHLGLRILYDLINRRRDYAAERVFSPWVDMEEKLRLFGIPLFSLESAVPVSAFDILGFSLQYELSYTNVLNILSLSGIPLKSCERSQGDPLIMAGGICALNPEPLSDFIDFFIIGEAEEAIYEILDVYKQSRKKPDYSREQVLKALSFIEGVYVPSFYRVEKDGARRRAVPESDVPERIHKRHVKDPHSLGDCKTWIVPYIEIVHDRIGLEIMRGCPNYCRFCQARNFFFPFRMLDKEDVMATARDLFYKTGYEEISLLSLSSSDHPDLEIMTRQILDELKGHGVSVSLPSLKAKNQIGGISRVLSSAKKTSLTFAPEAGSDRLRELIGKNLNMEEFYGVIEEAFRSGYRLLKLYFMIGLPTETYFDLDEIVRLCASISGMRKKIAGHPAQLNVSISNFVPKPHTPFQWQAMDDPQRLTEKQEYLKKALCSLRGMVHLKFHDVKMSSLEGILTRGDRRLGAVIKSAFEKGAKFDSWSQFFNFSIWQESLSEHGIDSRNDLEAKSYGHLLNWGFIDCGLSFEALKREAERAFISNH